MAVAMFALSMPAMAHGNGIGLDLDVRANARLASNDDRDDDA